MVPPILTDKLAGVRGRERFQRFAWGLCRVIAVALVVLLLACLIDWTIDRFQETPWPVRVGLLAGQGILAAALIVALVMIPLSKPLPDDELSLWVEAKNPQFKNRLISSVQLNRPDSRHEGMSHELIGVMTKEAEEQAKGVDFGEVVDNRRFAKGVAFLVPAVLLFAAPFLIWPALFPTLLSRQLLADVEIPRSVYLDVASPEVWPKGEVVRLEVKAHGEGLAEDPEGELIITWERSDLVRTRVPLKLAEKDGETATYYAEVPASSVNFTYGAWLGDGRLRTPGTVRYEPRPEVKEDAFVLLPEFCGTTPTGRPYDQPAGQGDVEGIAGSLVRVEIQTQKPVKSASILLTSFHASLVPLGLGGALIFKEPQRQEIPLDSSKQKGSVVFPLIPAGGDKKQAFAPYIAYTIEVVDEYGFENVPKPIRNLRVIQEPRPEVALLREQFPPDTPVDPRFADLYVHTGMPAREGDKIRVAYKCFGPYGLKSAFIEYRKVAQSESGNDEVKQDDWTRLPLPEETRINPKTGQEEDLGVWKADFGVFAKTPLDRSVPFFPLPSEEPEKKMGRIVGGGRYDLSLKGLITPRGKTLTLGKGDQLEYRVRVVSASGAKDNVSEIRVTTIEDSAGVWDWLTTTWAEQDRIRALAKGQGGVFEKIK